MRKWTMSEYWRRIPFEKFVLDLEDLFDSIAQRQETILVEREGQVFRLQIEEAKEPDIWVGYDPQQVRAALRKSAGALRDINRQELIADIHRAREQDSQGRPR